MCLSCSLIFKVKLILIQNLCTYRQASLSSQSLFRGRSWEKCFLRVLNGQSNTCIYLGWTLYIEYSLQSGYSPNYRSLFQRELTSCDGEVVNVIFRSMSQFATEILPFLFCSQLWASFQKCVVNIIFSVSTEIIN